MIPNVQKNTHNVMVSAVRVNVFIYDMGDHMYITTKDGKFEARLKVKGNTLEVECTSRIGV